jgi:hypothetical protein
LVLVVFQHILINLQLSLLALSLLTFFLLFVKERVFKTLSRVETIFWLFLEHFLEKAHALLGVVRELIGFEVDLASLVHFEDLALVSAGEWSLAFEQDVKDDSS